MVPPMIFPSTGVKKLTSICPERQLAISDQQKCFDAAPQLGGEHRRHVQKTAAAAVSVKLAAIVHNRANALTPRAPKAQQSGLFRNRVDMTPLKQP
jgi:hypothetical protein